MFPWCWVLDKRNSLSRFEQILQIWFCTTIHNPRAVNFIITADVSLSAFSPTYQFTILNQEDKIGVLFLEEIKS